MKSLNEASIEAKMDPNDITQLIVTGRIDRPLRKDGDWFFTAEQIQQLIRIPRDMLPSQQKLLRRRSFWSQKVKGVEIPPTVIALTRSACEDHSLLEEHKKQLMQKYAVEFVAYSNSVDPSWLSPEERKIFSMIYEACQGYVELKEALGLVEKRELCSTHQLALACSTTDAMIRKLWKERRIAPETISNSNAMLWRVDKAMVSQIKDHIEGVSAMPPQKFIARRDIIQFAVSEEEEG